MSDKVIALIKNIVVFIILLIGAIFVLQAMGTEIDENTGEPIGDVFAVSTSVNFSLALVWIILGLIGIFTIWSIISNPKKFIPTAIGVAVFAVVVLIGYSMSDVTATGSLATDENATEGALLWGSTGIQTTFVLVFLALALIVAQSIRGLIGYFVK